MLLLLCTDVLLLLSRLLVVDIIALMTVMAGTPCCIQIANLLNSRMQYAPMHMMALTVCIKIGNLLLPDAIIFVIYAPMHIMARTA